MTHRTDSASLNATFDVLGNVHRRRILLAISDHNPRDEDEFTPESLASEETDDDCLKRLKTELHRVLIDDHSDELPGGWL